MAQRSLPATRDNIDRAITMIEQQRGGGGTELLPALKHALAIPRDEGFSRSVVIATDGYVTVEEEAFDLIRNNLGKANMFTFGIGSSVNRHLIEGMARVGMGEPFVITRPEEAPEKAEKFRSLIQSPVLTQVKIDFNGFQVYDVEPPSIPDVLAERPVVVFGKWRGRPQGSIEMKGISGDQVFRQTIDLKTIRPLAEHSGIRHLWARHRIAMISDYNMLRPVDERVNQVTNLGLTYNLLTAYTSFVAIDTQVRGQGEKAQTVKQPLPLPQGVSDLAVGRGGVRQKTALAPNSPMVFMAPEGATADKCLGLVEATKPAESEIHTEEFKGLHVQLEDITVSEGLSGSHVRSVIEKALQTLEKCPSHAPGGARSGKAVFTLIIGPDGRVTKVTAQEIEAGGKAFEKCMVRHLKTLLFAPPAGHSTVKVSVTFRLNP